MYYYYFTPLILPLLLSTLLLVIVASYARAYTQGAAATRLFWAIISIALWSGAYALEIAATTENTKLFWANVQFIAIGAAPILWFLTVLGLVDSELKRSWFLLYLIPIPVVTLLLAWTSGRHDLFRGTPELVTMGEFLLLEADYRWWHNLVFVPYQYVLYVAALVSVVKAVFRARPYHRRRYVVMFISAMLPFVGGLFYVLGIPPFEYLNPAPLLLTVAVVLFAILVFRHRLFDVLPFARASIVENLEDGVIVLDGRQRVVDYNPSAATLFPTLQETSLGLPAVSLLSGDGELERLLGDPSCSGVHLELLRARELRQYRCKRSVVGDNRRRPIATILTFSDETEARELLQKLEDLASKDALTGLANRRAIFERFEEELSRARRYHHAIAFIIMDLDHFKRVNDSFGHGVGDEALRRTGEVLRESVRTGDVIGRYGGEEFALCLPEATPGDAIQFAERLRGEVGSIRISNDRGEVSFTASLGVCGVQEVRMESLQWMLQRADAALYEAKHLGRNRVAYCRGESVETEVSEKGERSSTESPSERGGGLGPIEG